jgi:hypothetical protein
MDLSSSNATAVCFDDTSSPPAMNATAALPFNGVNSGSNLGVILGLSLGVGLGGLLVLSLAGYFIVTRRLRRKKFQVGTPAKESS